MTSAEEKKLVAQARRDPEVFGVLFDHYYPRILSYAVRRLGNVQNAEDVTSVVFFKAMDKLWQFQWRDVSFSAWLYAIANNEIRQFFRSTQRRVFSLDQMMEERGLEWESSTDVFQELKEAQTAVEQHEQFLKVHAVLLTLPFKYQEVLTLKLLEGKKITEICEILGKREGTVKSLLSRGTKLLQQKSCNLFDDSRVVHHGEASQTAIS